MIRSESLDTRTAGLCQVIEVTQPRLCDRERFCSLRRRGSHVPMLFCALYQGRRKVGCVRLWLISRLMVWLSTLAGWLSAPDADSGCSVN